MKIEKLGKLGVPFNLIKPGDVFIYEGGTFIKLFTDKKDNACNLADGYLFCFDYADIVAQVNAKIVIEG